MPALPGVLPWWSRWWETLTTSLRQWTDPPPAAGVVVPGYWWPGDDGASSYAALYRTQPHVRTVVDFLSSQMGQLGIQVFRRLSDTDRVRVHGHPLAQLLRHPNEGTTRFAFITQLVQDWAVFGQAFAIKVRRPGRLELYRVPPAQVRGFGDLVPRGYAWTVPDGVTVALPASEVFTLRQYNPDDPIAGLSPLETLRKMLAEQAAATAYREWFWTNGAKLGGWIARPKEAPRWSEQQREDFRKQWAAFQGPQNAGKTAVLEDGMRFESITASAHESQLIEARKLSREEVAAAYHVPPAMLGILEAQGYGSLKEQHKALYQDTLGPLVALLEGEIERQLLTEFSDSDDVYVQFNINEKLQGSFEEEQAALITATGSPYMTRNEARARLNLPRINDASFDVPVTRLDIAEGQQAKANPPTAAPMSAVFIEPQPLPPPPDLDPIAQRIARVERALHQLPADVAAQLPPPPPPAAPPPAVIRRAERDETGRIVAFDEYGADGVHLGRRALVRDAEGRLVELEAPVEPA